MIAYLRRNAAEIANVIEAILRLAGSIASLTPTPVSAALFREKG